jgi:predicted transcriptional regulator
MRTTLRLDDDLAATLKEMARKEDVSFGRTLNRVLRAGLAARSQGPRGRKRFQQKTFDMGTPTFNIDKALALTAALDDDETTRKLALQK